MNVLVFNCGSSSLTFKVYEQGRSEIFLVVLSGKAHRVGVKGSESSFVEYNYQGNINKHVVNIPDHRKAANLVLNFVSDNKIKIDCIGHRFVHGGQYFRKTSLLGREELKKLEACIPLAPIHNPISLAVIDESKTFYPGLSQYVTFDSAFHSTIPEYAYTYALPKNIINKFGFRKYGFHGLSYSYVSKEAAYYLDVPKEKLKIVACHLGTGGSSVAAIKNGKSIDTSMGYSPLPGLIMSTRAGDVDPMLSIYLMAIYGYKSDEIMDLFNKKSGLLGVSGFSSDIRDIIKDFGEKETAQLAFDMKQLKADAVKIDFEYPFFIEKLTPKVKEKCLVKYNCVYSVKINAIDEKPKIYFKINVPVITTYPVSEAEKQKGLFGQLSIIALEMECKEDVYPEDVIEMVDKHALAPVYSFLTKEDQDLIIDKIHSVEKSSVVTMDEIKDELAHNRNIEWYSVVCSNFGMLHSYSTLIGTEKSMWIPFTSYE